MPPKANSSFGFGHSDRADEPPTDYSPDDDEEVWDHDLFEDELQSPEGVISRLERVEYSTAWGLLRDAEVSRRFAWPDRKVRVWNYGLSRWVLDEDYTGPWVYPAWHGEKALFLLVGEERWLPAVWRDADPSLNLEAGWSIGEEPESAWLRHR